MLTKRKAVLVNKITRLEAIIEEKDIQIKTLQKRIEDLTIKKKRTFENVD